MTEVSFGEWLKRRRKAEGLTQGQLAEKVSCSTITLRKIEGEERRPSAQIVERLAEVFKIPPNEQTSFLRFARGDWRSAPTETKESHPWQVSTTLPRSNVPATINSLIGRGPEIAEIHNYLLKSDIRLVTLIGPPGIGKTRLSIEVARVALHVFQDGVFFVALAPLDDASLIGVTIAQALGYLGARNISTVEQLKEGIGEKQVLMVLDNCEHLIEDIASLASSLLSACAHLKILATSRESLRVPGEWLYPVPAFDVPEEDSSIDIENISDFPALTLFEERARAVHPDFMLDTENVKTISAICLHLDGLPLAIELIAARMRLMSPQALLQRLDAKFILSADGMRAASTRQKTLNNAIHWSYDLLSIEEQKLFAYLSVFSGGFALEAAEAMFAHTIEKPISELITLLLDKSLLQRTFDEQGESLFSMLVTIQTFARDRLRQMGEETKVRDWHMAYFLELTEQADKELRGSNQLEWLHRLHAMRDNLRAALDWAVETRQTETALQMARDLHWFWFVRGDHTEGRRWLERAAGLPDAPLFSVLYAEVLTQIAHHTWLQIGPGEARPYVEQALHLAKEHDDKHNIARALTQLGLVLTHENNFTAAQSALEQSQTLFREVNDQWGYLHSVIALGLGTFMRDDLATALALHEETLAGFRNIGERYFEIVALRFIGVIQLKQGNLANGIKALQESLLLAQEMESTFEIAVVLSWLGEAAKYTGTPARAVHLYWAAKNILSSIGAWAQQRDESVFVNDLAPCRIALGEAAFAKAVEQGRAMTMEQAIQYALEQTDG